MDAAWLGVIIAAIGIIIASVVAWLTFIKGNPKKVLTYRTKVIPLMRSSDSLSQRLKVSFNDIEIKNPYILEIGIQSTGRADIRESDFDGKKPLVFSTGTETYLIEQTSSDIPWTNNGSLLEHAPMLLRRQDGELIVRYLCADRPTAKLEKQYLADTTVINYNAVAQKQRKMMARLNMINRVTTLLTLGLLVIAGIAVTIILATSIP